MIQPIRTQILVKFRIEDEQTKGGIFIPETCRKNTTIAEVVAVGNGTKKCKPKYQVGDIVYCMKEQGTELHENEEVFYLINADDENGAVLGYIPKEEIKWKNKTLGLI